MIKHIVAFRFKPQVSESYKEIILKELNHFPKIFSTMQSWSMGQNISERDDTFTHAFAVEFENERELQDYLNSEEHENFVRRKWRPVIEERAIMSYQY